MPSGIYKHKPCSEETRRKISSANKGKSKNIGRPCSIETRRKIGSAQIGEKNHMYGKKQTEEHRRKNSEANKGHTTSIETRRKISLANKGKPSNRKNYKHSEETKRKIGLANKGRKPAPQTIKALKESRAKQIFPIQDTSIEEKIQNFLKQLGIEFYTHQYLDIIEHGYQCDILIPSIKMVIECDGDYWHKYPIGTEIDHIRTKELIEKGFKVLRLWEKDIRKMTIEDFKRYLNI